MPNAQADLCHREDRFCWVDAYIQVNEMLRTINLVSAFQKLFFQV